MDSSKIAPAGVRNSRPSESGFFTMGSDVMSRPQLRIAKAATICYSMAKKFFLSTCAMEDSNAKNSA
jgi:hypothetical protein